MFFIENIRESHCLSWLWHIGVAVVVVMSFIVWIVIFLIFNYLIVVCIFSFKRGQLIQSVILKQRLCCVTQARYLSVIAINNYVLNLSYLKLISINVQIFAIHIFKLHAHHKIKNSHPLLELVNCPTWQLKFTTLKMDFEIVMPFIFSSILN